MNKLIYIFFITTFAYSLQAWSWLHDIRLSEEHVAHADSWEIEKRGIPRFSQLIFSWNAFRPDVGYFSFWIQVRDSITKNWYRWHQMAQWGRSASGSYIQRSLVSKSRGGTNYLHVCLELPRYRFADAFRIKVKAHNRASLKNVKRVAVNTVNTKHFISEICSRLIQQLPSVYIASVPRKSQMRLKHPENTRLCSPTSTTMLLSYLLNKTLDPRDIAHGVYDNGLRIYGSWPFNIAHAFEHGKGKISFHVERLDSFKTLHKQLSNGIPVIVSVRGLLKGAPIRYNNGHLLLVVGYNKKFKKVLCHDPAFKSDARTAVAYDLKSFLRAWERSQRLAYMAKFVTP